MTAGVESLVSRPIYADAKPTIAPDENGGGGVNAFIVTAKDEPGKLAEVSKALGDKGVNIVTGSVIAAGETGAFGFISNDEAGTRAVLRDLECSVREIEVIPVSIADEPGALAKVATKLADAGVNIALLLPTGMSGGKQTVALGVDNVAAARKAIGQEVATPV